MSKIYLNKELVWDKKDMPTEREALRLIADYYSGEISLGAAEALTCGITVRFPGYEFEVELTTDYEKVIHGNRSRNR